MLKLIAGALLLAVSLDAQTRVELIGPSCPGNTPAVLSFQLTLDGFKSVPTCLVLGSGLQMVDGKLTVQFPPAPPTPPTSYGRVDRIKVADIGPFTAAGGVTTKVKLQATPIKGTAVFALFTGGIFVPIDIQPSDGTRDVEVTIDVPPPIGAEVVIMYWSTEAPPQLP